MAPQTARGVVGRVKVNDGKAVGAICDVSTRVSKDTSGTGARIAYDAKATSLPHGEMVADPTRPSTWIVRSWSKVALSKADLMGFPFFGA